MKNIKSLVEILGFLCSSLRNKITHDTLNIYILLWKNNDETKPRCAPASYSWEKTLYVSTYMLGSGGDFYHWIEGDFNIFR